ncbi:MAG: hypothetical protein KAR44_08150 [Candidatus Aegiribacteria sp.]|nr:hypothetical protein [Candidatus Aegiribacteria sp.]
MFTAFILQTDLEYPFRGDEEHFISTVELFGENYHPRTALDYPEVTGPLFYYMYASWGKLTGFNPANLRFLNMLLSAVTFVLLYLLYGKVLQDLKIVLPGLLLLLLNPYFWGLSMHVFTDIPSLLFIVLIAFAVYIGTPVLLLLSTACALLIRQYSVFMVISAAAYYFIQFRTRHRFGKGSFIALIFGAVPLLVLMLLWKGTAPPTGILRWVIDDGSVYRLRYIYIYIIFIAASLFPLLIYAYRILFINRIVILSGFLLSLTYFFFPVQSSSVTLEQTGGTTVGLMHSFIRGVLDNYYLEQFVFWIFCWAGFITLVSIIRTDIARMKTGKWDFGHFLTLSVIIFLLIMPFSYQVWEKYLIVVLPFILLRLLMMIGARRLSDVTS